MADMTEEQKQLLGASAEYLYHSARFALRAGLTRSEWETLAGIWFGQAGADHAHAVAAEAFQGARKGEP